MPVCFYFHPDGYTTKGRQVMGRHVAGESFLQAALRYGAKGDLWIQLEQASHGKEFSAIAQACGRHEPVHTVQRKTLDRMRQPGCVYLPGPGLGEWARHRSFHGDDAWSICGITHTTASTRAMDAIAELLVAPVQPWDALICTSRAVHNHVSRILHAEVDYLKRRFAIQRFTLPQLPIIPLGVHADAFQPSATAKAEARRQMAVPDGAVVVLFVGRLAFHGKAHPLVMYQALEQAAKQTQRPVVLVECGWHANEALQQAFAQAAAAACPSVRVITMNGRVPEQLRMAWQLADLFCSLSDNIQETFGITPIEAMAAGLPVVVTDWDGYRDTVRDGQDGFRIPTVMPPPGCGDDLTRRHALGVDTYDMYCAYTSSMVAVDVRAATQAFARLIGSASLRQTMGASGRQHVLSRFDWRVIIPRYEQLWDELAARRVADAPTTKRTHPPGGSPHAWPARLDPFYGFASYPTAKLKLHSVVMLLDANAGLAVHRLRAHLRLEMVKYVAEVMAPQQQLELLLQCLDQGPVPLHHLLRELRIKPDGAPLLLRSIAWLIKLGIIGMEPTT